MKFITTADEIAFLSTTVVIRGDSAVVVSALELNQISALIFKHNKLRSLFGEMKKGDPSSFFEIIMSSGSEVIHDLVQESTKIQGLGSRLSALEQGRIILSCLEMTLPKTEVEMNDFLAQIASFANQATLLQKVAAKKKK